MFRRALRIAAATALAGGTLIAGAPVAYGEPWLEGPHPFGRDNEISLHGGFGFGLRDTFSGTLAQLNYGYQLRGSLWLALEGGFVGGGCPIGACGTTAGDLWHVFAGAKWKAQTEIPLVPYGKMAAGLIAVLPDTGDRRGGFGVRVAVGAQYFLYEGLGIGAEVGFLAGATSGRQVAILDPAVTVLDVGLGVEVQFD
jgi:hypothetical protein